MCHRSSLSPAIALCLSSMLLLSACDSNDVQHGTLDLDITDTPVDMADNVFVQFSGIEIHANGNNNITQTFDPPKQIDLLALQGGNSAVIVEGLTLEAADYQWIRLMVDTDGDLDSYIVVNGQSHELTIPSGDQTGLKLVSGFTVPANGVAKFTIDFNLRKSVHTSSSPNGIIYRMKPSLRLIDNTRRGIISGTVNATLLSDPSCSPNNQGNYVYAYEGSNITPVDISDTGSGPVSTGPVVFDNDLLVFSYELSFLPAGNYTIALTCQGDNDDPETVDTIDFINPANVSVEINTTTEHNF